VGAFMRFEKDFTSGGQSRTAGGGRCLLLSLVMETPGCHQMVMRL